MRYHEIIKALTEEPLLITPAAHASIFKLFEDHRTLEAAAFKAAREGVDACGDEIDLEQMEVIDGVAYVPIRGPIGRGLGKFEKGAGAVDVADVMAELRQADKNPDVSGILLLIDSPGGMVSGTPELADVVASIEKPVFAFTPGEMASAAYWVGAAADRVFATKSANVGSIGVYLPFYDMSKRVEAAGVKVDVIASGKYKGLGMPGTSLTAEQREFLQARVNEIATMFQEHVWRNRGAGVDLGDMQGQIWTAPAALRKGLLDEIVNDADDVAALLR